MNVIGQRDLKPCPFYGYEPMSGEFRPVTHKSPPLLGISCIHCGTEMTGEFIDELTQRWNARATATASIDKKVMKGALNKERRDVAERLWRHIDKPLLTGQDIGDIVGVRRSDFNLIPTDASYRRLADLTEPEPGLPLDVCPFCGTCVTGEGRNVIHGQGWGHCGGYGRGMAGRQRL